MCGADGHIGIDDLVVSLNAWFTHGGAFSTHTDDATTIPDDFYDGSSTLSCTHISADSFETMDSRSPACSSGE